MKSKKTRLTVFVMALLGLAGLGILLAAFLQGQPEDTKTQSASISQPQAETSPRETQDSQPSSDLATEEEVNQDLTQTYEEAVAQLCAEVGQQECERLLGSADQGQSENPTFTSPSAPSSSKAPRQESGVSRGFPSDFDLNQPKYVQPEIKPCPDTRAEDPEAYDRCHDGYSPPRIEWAGYLSCRKFVDPKFGEVVEVVGRIQLIGGNFLSSDWGPQSELLGENSYRLVSSLNTEAPYFLIWYDYIRIAPMDDAFMSWIDEVGAHGAHLIPSSQMDPACLQD